MKFKWTEDTAAKVVAGSVIAAIAITFYFLIQNIGGIFDVIKSLFKVLSPFVIGFVIAYLLTRPVNFIERLLNRHLWKKAKKQKAINRGIAIVLVFILFMLLLALVMYSIIPQLIESVTTLARNADGYIKSINTLLDKLFTHFNIDASFLESILGSSQEMFKSITEYVASKLPQLLDFSVSIGSGISNFFIGFIVSVYMLSGKERFAAQIKKILFAVFPRRFVDETIGAFSYMHETFGKYFSGQTIDSVVLGIICFILMSAFKMEYALLISMIIMITNFIPFIGPFIGAVPSAFILLMVQPTKVLWFIIMIVVLQQIEGNIIAPKIVGKTTGLSSFWVVFSIIIGSGLFGITGVILAVPTFSVVYTFAKRFIERRLREKDMPIKTTDYIAK